MNAVAEPIRRRTVRTKQQNEKFITLILKGDNYEAVVEIILRSGLDSDCSFVAYLENNQAQIVTVGLP